MKIIWGINILSHDSSLSVLKNNEIVFASSSERFSKIKNDSNLNQEIINYALNFGYPDKIILSEKNYLKNIRKFLFGQSLKTDPQKYLKSFGLNNYNIESTYHHEAHASAGYFTSNFNSATILIIDAIGEWDTISIWKAKGNKLKKIYSQIYPNSIGLFYSAMTQRIGLKPNEEEYILMALAAYGDKNKFKGEMINLFFNSFLLNIKFDPDLESFRLSWLCAFLAFNLAKLWSSLNRKFEIMTLTLILLNFVLLVKLE
jgi:carbamoyltransferase